MDTSTVLLPLMRGVHLAALLSLFGSLLFAVVVAPVGLRMAPAAAADLRATLTRLAWLSLVLTLALGVAWFAAEAHAVATPDSPGDWFAALRTMAGGTRFGRFLALRLALLVAAAPLLRQAPIAAAVLAGLALGLQPAFGHAGAQGGGMGAMLVGSEALHLLAAGAWLGGLLPLLVCVARLPPRQAASACERFTPLGLASVGVIAITACFQASQLVGSVPALLGTGYGRVALLKLGLFAVALGLAALNRWRFTARLADAGEPARARWQLRLSIGVETALGLAIVLAAGFLASRTPAAQEQPLWPFSWRLTFAALDDADVRVRVALALVAAGVGVASTVLGLLWRRARIALVAFGACLLVAAAPTVRLLLVEAYPTSYYRSPTGFAAVSITRGGNTFAANCAACHGAEGRGDGPLASQLPLRPADLTAAHLWGHSDGELFWWVSHGRQAPDGTPVMPAFAPLLSDTDRWSVIDFVRANNAGISERSSGAWVVPIAAPALPVVCAGLAADEMRELHGSVVRVVADGDEDGASHPPSIPPQEGYKVVILHLRRGASRGLPMGECMAATPAAWGAYATLVGLRPEALPGAEFLVDPNGWLRAAWLPNSGRGWSTPDQLIAQVRLICTHPIAINTGGGHEHHD
ncbi:MAG: CopD family protein [Acetobacteraceae bacterium]|jgi:putative copper export protein/mono/diheme cytochrome c family protein